MPKQPRKFWIICIDDEPMWAYTLKKEAKEIYDSYFPEENVSLICSLEVKSKSCDKVKRRET